MTSLSLLGCALLIGLSGVAEEGATLTAALLSLSLCPFRAHRSREEAGSFSRISGSAAAVTQRNLEVPHGAPEEVSAEISVQLQHLEQMV